MTCLPVTISTQTRFTFDDGFKKIVSLADIFCFEVCGSFDNYKFLLEIKPQFGGTDYKVICKAYADNDEAIRYAKDFIYVFNPMTTAKEMEGLTCIGECIDTIDLNFTVNSFKSININGSYMADMRREIAKSEMVTLHGADGTVEVELNLLKCRSTVFTSMFTYKDHMRNEQLITVNMCEFRQKTLTSFVRFLATDQIENLNDTAIDLFILADKYDLPLLQFKAGSYMMDNLNSENYDEVYDLVSKIQPSLIKTVIKKICLRD